MHIDRSFQEENYIPESSPPNLTIFAQLDQVQLLTQFIIHDLNLDEVCFNIEI